MCRFLAYSGPTVELGEMLYEPEHSLIHQSVHAHEREEPLNGDGWGVGWYDPRAGEQPGLYRTLHPAWSDENMRHVAPLIQTPMFLAHVRAASPGLPVQQLNCHPFRGGEHTHADLETLDPVERGRRRLLFMHNGGVAGFKKIRRSLLDRLSQEAFDAIRGSTDSEHVFALIQDALGDDAEDPSAEDLAEAIQTAVGDLAQLQAANGIEADTDLNVCLTDGTSMVAMRYVDDPDQDPPSLYVGQAGGFFCESAGRLTARDPDAEDAVLVASERLWEDERVWSRVPANHLALIEPDGSVRFEPVSTAG